MLRQSSKRVLGYITQSKKLTQAQAQCMSMIRRRGYHDEKAVVDQIEKQGTNVKKMVLDKNTNPYAGRDDIVGLRIERDPVTTKVTKVRLSTPSSPAAAALVAANPQAIEWMIGKTAAELDKH